MSTSEPRVEGHVIRREVLDHAAHGLLAELLTPFASFFERHGVRLDLLAGSKQTERAIVGVIHALVHDDGTLEPPPDDLVDVLSALDTLATPEAASDLIRLDTAGALPRGTHGDADLALVALLRQPDLAALVVAENAREAEHKFAEYAPAVAGPVLSLSRPSLEKIEKLLGARMQALDHTRHCRIELTKNRWYVELEIQHGSRPQTRDTIHPESLAIEQRTDITARRSFARIERRTGRLAIRAYPRIRECIRQTFGEAIAGDAAHFCAEGLYDLNPFRDLATAVTCARPIKNVEVHMIAGVMADGVAFNFKRTRKDILASGVRPLVEQAVRDSSPIAVRLYLEVEGRPRPIRVELVADGKKNVVDYNRDDSEVRRIVEGYLTDRVIMRRPTANGAAEAETSS